MGLFDFDNYVNYGASKGINEDAWNDPRQRSWYMWANDTGLIGPDGHISDINGDGKRDSQDQQIAYQRHADMYGQHGAYNSDTKQTWLDNGGSGPTQAQAAAVGPGGVAGMQYGGYVGGAEDMSNLGLRGMGWAQGQASQNRGAQAIEDQILSDREAGMRYGDQLGALQLHREAAMGLAPSQAAYLMQSGLDRSLANQQSMAAGARGASAIAMAQGNAQANNAALQNQAFTNAAAMRAGEMAQARGAYGDLASGIRGQDLNRLGMGNQMSQFNAGLNDQYRLGMGQLGLGYYNAAQRPHDAQLSADTSAYATSTGSSDYSKGLAAQEAARRSANRRADIDKAVSAGGTFLGAIGGALQGAFPNTHSSGYGMGGPPPPPPNPYSSGPTGYGSGSFYQGSQTGLGNF